jgi:hypothetical protein
MAQRYEENKVPFTNMTFHPDVPSSALGPNEYNSGFNVETDIRGIRSVLGDEEILDNLTGTPIFVTGGYRGNGDIWWFIVATSAGRWYATNGAGAWIDVSPGGVPLSGYSLDTNITDAWNGTTLFINDGLHPPMYLTANAAAFIQYSNDPLAAPPAYVWNYNDDWSSLTAGWMRLYNTPNVGSILIAGNLTSVDANTSVVTNFATTVRWSNAFGLNDGPTTWAPTAQNVANELEVPVRGPVLDGFPSNGNFYVCSYWDTVVFSPINFQNATAPVLGVRLFNQGRGLLNANCWANADNDVYGVDARDIWVFNGQEFAGLGSQRIRNYFFENLNVTYADRVFVENNTRKSQVEIYYPDLNSTGWCNKMISYNYLLKVWNPPRDVSNASMACEAPVYGPWPDSSELFDPASRTMVYSRGVANTALVQKDQGYTFLGNTAIASEFRRDNIQLLKDYSGHLLVHRILPEVVNLNEGGLPLANSTGNITVAVGGSNSVGQPPDFQANVTIACNTNSPWTQIDQNAYRINSIRLNNTSNSTAWLCSATTWQYTQTQDDR